VPPINVIVFRLINSVDVVIPAFLVLILSLSVHEAAHAGAADRLGDPTARLLGRLTLNPLSHIDWIGTVLFPLVALFTGLPLFGWAKPVPVSWANLRSPRRDFALVAVAGPISNILLAVVASAAVALLVPLSAMAPDGTFAWPGQVLLRMVVINVLLAVFNMIPIPPLDGGNVLAGLVPESMARGLDWIRPHGFMILILLLYTDALGLAGFASSIQYAIVGWLL
jgi:Zn-dependent protease